MTGKLMQDTEARVFDVAALLGAVFDGETLPRKEARLVMGRLMDGLLSQIQAAALLAALRTRGETVEEIIGFAQAMRERAVHVPVQVDGPLLDTCGTGGTGLDTLNISTTAMFVVAAGGVKVAKHGNRGVTRKSGSADLLELLGVNLDASPQQLADSVHATGLAFIFSRNHHPAMKFVAPVRSDLKARTVFNSLGPLTNPAGANRQVLGVYSADLTEKLALTLAGLGVERALVVHGAGLDDLTVTGVTQVSELAADGSVHNYELAPEEFGLQRYGLGELAGGDAATNLQLTLGVLDGSVRGAPRDVVLLTSGASLYLAGAAGSVGDGVALARELLDSGSARAKLDEYLAFNRAVR
jgi:anthranilate phosphoribosyltransferase